MKNPHTAVLAEFGLTPQIAGGCPIPVILHGDITALCLAQSERFATQFNELANGQTCSEFGMYYYDVADILRTIQTGIEKEDWD